MPERLAASTNSYHTHSLEDALAGIAAAGLRSVELASVPGWTEHVSRNADDEEIQTLKDLLARYDLTPVNLSGHSDLVTDEGVDEFRKALDLCRRLGIAYVTTSTGGHDASSAGSLDEQREAFLARIGGLADEAAADGITICLETHGGLLATGAISADLIRQIDKPNVGITYDPGNVIFYGDTRPEEDVTSAVEFIKTLHAKDQIGGVGKWHFPTIGTGEVDYPRILAALDAAGFDGPCAIEIEFQGDPFPSLDEVDRAMADSVRYLRPLVNEGTEGRG
jgi:sugar phosphate isomerase/epimerase